MIYRSPFLVNTISDMISAKDEKRTHFCVSFPEVFVVVIDHKPLFCSNSLKFSWVLFEVFIKSPVQYYIDFKALDLTNFNDFRFSEQGKPLAAASTSSS